jgi:hypothetical protein
MGLDASGVKKDEATLRKIYRDNACRVFGI